MIALMPHGSCFLWDPRLTALHVASDGLVMVAYFSIPLMLLLNRQHNDIYGHSTGDDLLRSVARVLRYYSRNIDLAARLGGDEFALLLIGCSVDEAASKAEAIRQKIQHLPLPGLSHAAEGDRPAGVSASIGVSELLPGQALSQSYQQADSALYRAKRSGKNRVDVAMASGAIAPDMLNSVLNSVLDKAP